MTKEILESHISEKKFYKVGNKTTICLLILDNGFEVVGTSHVINPLEFNVALGEQYAYENAVEKLRDLYAFLEHNKKGTNQK